MDTAQKIKNGIRECVGMYKHIEDGKWGALYYDWANDSWLWQTSRGEIRYDVVVDPAKVVPLPH